MKNELSELLKEAGYGPRCKYHYPETVGAEKSVRVFERIIKEAGYPRTKSPNSSEYQYQYQVEDKTVVFNYRFGEVGLSAWWIKYSPVDFS